MRRSIGSLLVFVLSCSAVWGKILTPVTLEQVVTSQPIIFSAKIAEYLPERPGMVFAPTGKIRGEFPFDRVPVNLTGDDEAAKEKQSPMLLERLDKDLEFLVFASRRGKTYDAIAYSNGTWFRMLGTVEQVDGKDVTRWRFTHGEPYFRRTFKGTTEELKKAIEAGIKGEKLPAYNEKEEPGYGPPLRKAVGKDPKQLSRRPSFGSGNTPYAVIQLPFLGLIAALAAIFPVAFGGLAFLMRRWMAALSVAGIVSMVAAIVMYFPNWLAWSGLNSLFRLWCFSAVLCALGAVRAAMRFRNARRDGRAEDFQSTRLDRIGLAVFAGVLIVTLIVAVLFDGSLRDSPWLELTLLAFPVTASALFVLASRSSAELPGLSAETAGLWAGCATFSVAAALFVAPTYQTADLPKASAAGRVLESEPKWVFEPKEGGEVVSSPCVADGKVFVAVHHRAGFSQYGRVYALDSADGKLLWEFDADGELKEVFCSPVYAGGRLYFGEGYHVNRDSKMYCIDAGTGKKVWDFATTSHTESTPAVSDGKVVFGAGDDGVYCLSAADGTKHWQYSGKGGLHVDSNPLILNGRVYAGSGSSQRNKITQVFCLDLQSGNEIWAERTEYSAWGSPAGIDDLVYFPTGNGTFSEKRDPVAGRLLCRSARDGKPVWERDLKESIVSKPAVDRYQVYVGCRDGSAHAFDRRTGEPIWELPMAGPVLAAPVIDLDPRRLTCDAVYVINNNGVAVGIRPGDGKAYWTLALQPMVKKGHVNTISTPAVVADDSDTNGGRRIFIGLGMAETPSASPNARLYCFVEKVP